MLRHTHGSATTIWALLCCFLASCSEHSAPKTTITAGSSNLAILTYATSKDGGAIVKEGHMIDSDDPLLAGPHPVNLQPTGPDGRRFGSNILALEWLSGRSAADEPTLTSSFPDLIPKINALNRDSKATSLVLYKLPPGKYVIEAFLTGHCYAFAHKEVQLSEGLIDCPVQLPPVACVTMKLFKESDRRRTAELNHQVTCVFRFKDRRAKSCIWSSPWRREFEGVTEICVPYPAKLEGWLVTQKSKDDAIPGMGVELDEIDIPTNYRAGDDLPIKIKDPAAWDKRLPDWVIPRQQRLAIDD